MAHDDSVFSSEGGGDFLDVDDDEISVYAEALLETLNDVYDGDDDDDNDNNDVEDDGMWEDIDKTKTKTVHCST